MGKRGQIGLYVIAGMVIVIIVAVIFIEWDQNFLNFQDKTTNIIQKHIENCMKQTTNEAIFSNGNQGGYFLPPIYQLGEIPYYHLNGQKIIPSDKKLEQELEIYLDTLLDLCLDDFSTFIEEGYTIKYETPSSDIKFKEQIIEVNLNMPTLIIKNDKTTIIKEYTVTLPKEQMYASFTIAKEIVNTYSDKGLCITCFGDTAEKYDLFVSTQPLKEGYLIDIKNNGYLLNNEPFYLTFLIKP